MVRILNICLSFINMGFFAYLVYLLYLFQYEIDAFSDMDCSMTGYTKKKMLL